MSLFFLVEVRTNELCYLPWGFWTFVKMLSSFLVQTVQLWGFCFLILLPLTFVSPTYPLILRERGSGKQYSFCSKVLFPLITSWLQFRAFILECVLEKFKYWEVFLSLFRVGSWTALALHILCFFIDNWKSNKSWFFCCIELLLRSGCFEKGVGTGTFS